MIMFNQLFKQVNQALVQQDFDLLKILVQGQEKVVLIQLSNKLEGEDKKKKFDQFLIQWESQQKEKNKRNVQEEKIKNNIHIKNHTNSEEDSNIIQKELKRKKKIVLQQKFGYVYYGHIKCLMIAYGDINPKEESVKIMHSQIQVLFQFVYRFIIESLVKGKVSQSKLTGIITNIFQDQAKSYYLIKKQYHKVKHSQKDENVLSDSSDLESSSQDQIIRELRHMEATTIQQAQYFASLTLNMTEMQYQTYSECRTVNFFQYFRSKPSVQNCKKFYKFLNFELKETTHYYKLLDLISFVCCRLIRKIMFMTIRKRYNNKLIQMDEPLREEEIRKQGNSLIQMYQKKIVQAKSENEQIEKKAMKVFTENFNDKEFKKLLPKKIMRKKAQQVWHDRAVYRDLWVMRLLGQQQIERQMIENKDGEYIPTTEYGKYIDRNIQTYKKQGKQYLWKKYFSLSKTTKGKNESDDDKQGQKKEQKQEGKPKKRVKLQSLKS